MNEKTELKRMFEYERWASGLWLDCLAQSDNEPMREVFRHNLMAYELWRERVLGLPRAGNESPDADRLDTICANWDHLIDGRDLDEMVQFKNFGGDSFSCRFSDIVRHVLNHATYHRGQLREMAERAGLNYPETDFIIFARTSQAVSSA